MGRKRVRGLNKRMICEVCGSSTAHLERKNDHRHTRTCSRECKAELISRSKTAIDPTTGLSKGKIGWLKAAETKRANIVNGEDSFVRAAKKASAKMARDGTRAVAIEKWRSTMVFDEAHSEKIRAGMAKSAASSRTTDGTSTIAFRSPTDSCKVLHLKRYRTLRT